MIFRRNITFRNIDNWFLCEENCRKGLLAKIKPYGFILFAKRYGIETLLNCFEENEKNGIVYHQQGIVGDYDEFEFSFLLIQPKGLIINIIF